MKYIRLFIDEFVVDPTALVVHDLPAHQKIKIRSAGLQTRLKSKFKGNRT
jgi:hypothetical protein